MLIPFDRFILRARPALKKPFPGEGTTGHPARSRRLQKSSFFLTFSLAFLAANMTPCLLRGQQQRTAKIPAINRLRIDDIHQAYTGVIRSVDPKLKILNLKSQDGPGNEIFPLKKTVEVKTAEGKKMKLTDLRAGCDVVIYYELKGGERTVKQIILLTPGAKTKKRNSPPS